MAHALARGIIIVILALVIFGVVARVFLVAAIVMAFVVAVRLAFGIAAR